MIILQQDCVVNHVIRNYGIIMDQLIHISVSADQLHDTIAVRLCDTPCDTKLWCHVMDQLKPTYVSADPLHDSIALRLCDTPCVRKLRCNGSPETYVCISWSVT